MTGRWDVVKGEVCRQKLRFRIIDSTRAGTEVKKGVIEIQLYLEILDFLAVEAIAKEGLLTACLRKLQPRRASETTLRELRPGSPLERGHAPTHPESRDYVLPPNQLAPATNTSWPNLWRISSQEYFRGICFDADAQRMCTTDDQAKRAQSEPEQPGGEREKRNYPASHTDGELSFQVPGHCVSASKSYLHLVTCRFPQRG